MHLCGLDFHCCTKLFLCCRYGNKSYYHNISLYAKECSTYNFTGESRCIESDLSTCFDLSEEVDCSKYIHDMTADDAFWSLAAEYDWVCDKAEYSSTVLAAQNVGIIVSTLIFMQLSDIWGRRPVFHLTNIIYIISRIIALHITSHFWAFLVVIAAGSTFSPLGLRIGYTLAAELTNDRGRLWVYMVGWITWVAGMVFLPSLAWLSKGWYVYGLIVPLLNLALVPFIW